MAATNRTLIIMAKAPRAGAVKTRLVDSFPLHAVTELYLCLLRDTIDLAQALDNVEIALMCPEADAEDLSRVVPESVRIVAQSGRGLAAGLSSVFAQFAAAGRRFIAFNSDSPHLPASALAAAFDSLETCDLIVGPTRDGGYYLVGGKAHHQALFEGDGMGTTSALEALMARARALQLSVGFTESFYDIDVPADLIPLDAELRLAPARAPRTALWLKQWGREVSKLRAAAGSP
jgi:uncharacterized protein